MDLFSLDGRRGLNFSIALMRGQDMNTNAVIFFNVKCKKYWIGENNCHSMGTYYPALITACHSFQTHDGLRKETRTLIWKYVSHHKR